MPYRICKSFEVENGHMLSKHPDACKYPHGHTRTVEVVLEAEALDANDMVCDFKVIKAAAGAFIASLDHAMCMNTGDAMYRTFKDAYGDRIIGFDGQDPTTEVVARLMFEHIRQALSTYTVQAGGPYPLSSAVRLVRVRLWETSSSWAEYEG